MTNTTTSRITRAMRFETLKGFIPETHPEASELIAFLEKEIAQASKKHTESEKEKAEKQAQKEKLREAVLGVLMEASEPMSTTQIGSALGLSTQKVTPAITALKEAEMVICTKVKGKNLYSVA